jgi:hypothetical protein
MKKNNIELDPDCLRNLDLSMMVTNTGHLLPCSQLNVGQSMRDPKLQELMKYTKLSDYNSIEDITSHPKWLAHFKNLKKNIAPDRCFFCCQAGNAFNKHSMWTITDTDGKDVVEK